MNNSAQSAPTGKATGILPERVDEMFIVERIHDAVMDQRLAPATKLNELKLCDTFGVGRMRVQRALLLLSNRGIVELETNKGAFVASPSPSEANEVFEARSILEPAVVRHVVADIGPGEMKILLRHISLEGETRDGDRIADLIRLSGEFHVKLAAATGNSFLLRSVRELVARSSLIFGLFGTSDTIICPDNEHKNILDAVERGDPEAAEAMMFEHINRIKAGLDFSTPRPQEGDLAEILGLK
ncbi:MAG: GntR family transcriptional regulator [Albidovulum sp.]|nr:GntR family transcriptional regulator [Albidovulum sp.]